MRPATYSDPAEAIEAIQPAMVALLELLGEIAGDAGAPAPGGKLEGQLQRWAAARGDADAPPPGVLKLGVLAWSRLHGIASLELAGILGDMGLDAGLLAQAEVDDLVASAAGRYTVAMIAPVVVGQRAHPSSTAVRWRSPNSRATPCPTPSG